MIDTDKIILTDIDDVLWYFVEAWIDWLNAKNKLNKRVEDCLCWDINKLFPTLTEEQLFEPWQYESFWKTIKPRVDAQEIIPKLQDKGYIIKCCSATSFKCATIKLKEFSKYFPTIKEEDIILCDDKTLIKGNYLIDDRIINLENRKYPILMTTYPNKSTKVDLPIIRVNDWYEIYNYICNTV